MTIIWDMVSDDTREAIKKRMPKNWKPPVKKKPLKVKYEGKITGDIEKEMKRIPRDTRRIHERD